MNSLLCRLYREQKGQTLYLVAASMIAILGMAALSIDIGFAMHAQRELQAITDASAGAGGAAMPNPTTTSVVGVVNKYSGSTAQHAVYNVNHDLNITGVSVSFSCLSTTTYPSYGLNPCATSGNTGSPSYPQCQVDAVNNPYGGCNAIKVTETATVPTFFAKIFGFGSLTLSATSVASASGSSVPYHIMLVLDATASMASGSDTGCLSSQPSKTFSPEQCAQMGAQTLLGELDPCAEGATCGGSSAPVDEVGIMAFPGTCSQTLVSGKCPNATTLTNTTPSPFASDDYSCPPIDPPITSYNNNPAYLILGFQDNYRLTDTSALNTSSNLAETVGAGTWVDTGTTNRCGMPAPGGEGTFYAGAIVAAQTYLTSNHTAHVQDVMILLSDGSATADTGEMGGSVPQSVIIPGMTGSLYSARAECQQAVNAASYAKTTKQSDGTATEIYSVSYGSETSGCTAGDTITPCQTMEDISSLPLSQYFYSVPQTVAGKTTTKCSGAVPISQLDQVFKAIGSYLQSSKLLPVGVTGTWTTSQ